MVHGWSQPIWLLVTLADFLESHETSVTWRWTKRIRRPDFPCKLKQISFLLNLILIFYEGSSLETSPIIIRKSVDLMRNNWQNFNTTTLRLACWISWLQACGGFLLVPPTYLMLLAEVNILPMFQGMSHIFSGFMYKYCQKYQLPLQKHCQRHNGPEGWVTQLN